MTHIAVYLNGRPVELDPNSGIPINYDLLRQPDQTAQQNGSPVTNPEQQDQGLLLQISETDLVDTDIITYREANGKRVMERNKLQPYNALTGIGKGSSFGAGLNDDGSIYFNTPMLWTRLSAYRGEQLLVSSNRPKREYSNQVLQVDVSKNPNAWRDEMRPGEVLNTYLINRASGYIGMSRVQIDTNAGSTLPGTFSPPTQLLPPNLKIRVERKSQVQAGINQGAERSQLVGFEGSGLTSDTLLVITTEWYQQDGSPLPDDLPGYTARLAKVVSNSGVDRLEDVAVGNFVAQFAIEPGTHTKSIYIPEDKRPDHFYIHVSGQPIERQSDFSAKGGPGILGERPAKYVPFKVAVYDEAATNQLRMDARQAGTDPKEIKPVYNWVYRPEMQFSVFDLTINDIQRDDDSGLESILNLERPGVYAGDTIDVLLTLLSPINDALQSFGPGRELILAIGEYEQVVTLDENLSSISLIETEFLGRLEYEDYLTISLYQNSDSANILWEYGFVINGLHVYYQLPNHALPQQIFLEDALELGARANSQMVRTLGGIRLRYEYRVPYGNEIQSVKWSFDQPGWYCNGPGVNHPTSGADQCEYVTAGGSITRTVSATVPNAQDPDCSITACGIWWEPSTGGANAEIRWDADLAINGNYDAVTRDEITAFEQNRTSDFVVQTRELKPVPGAPMNGTDVEMLEGILWQLGLSPQINSPGSQGARINSDRGLDKQGAQRGWTQTCDSQNIASDRSIYYIGLDNCLDRSGVSTEAMVRRFQGRNDYNCSPCSAEVSGKKSDGIVDTVVLNDLSETWSEYYNAYSSNKNNAVVNFTTTGINTWLTAATGLWENGGIAGSNIPATYTQSKHALMLTAAGQSNTNAFTRVELLRAWKSQEAQTHWGSGFPQTNYRIFEGGADEYGSIGFSQILYSLGYGVTGARCDALKNYNLYDPAQAISGMIAFVAADNNTNGNCKKSFFNAFHANGNWSSIQSGNVDLIGYRLAGQTAIQPMTQSRVDDEYERLMKGIAGYNGSDGTNYKTWANMLKSKHDVVNGQHVMAQLYSNRTYAMQVMARYGIPKRTYIWVGARDPQGQPLWCFAFGEEEWMNPVIDALGQNWNWINYKKEAASDITKRVACP